MTTLRLLEPTEQLADLFGEPDPLLHPPPSQHRWHCGRCGRFVRFSTVRHIPHWEYGYGAEQDDRGNCSTCGADVDVVWGAG